jgi:hypothetical protein
MTTNYNPQPTRVWTRVQNQCSTNQNNTNIANDIIYIPLTKQYVTPQQAQFQAQMLQKGNVLQYKKNSANLTKSQKYSRISNGYPETRKKSYATQSDTYSNPNTASLLRVNYTSFPYPNNIVGAPNNPSSPFQIPSSVQLDCSSNILKDGGNLVLNTYQNQCSNEIIKTASCPNEICFSTSCSDVPGNPIELCWYQNIQSWYPRTRYIMPNSLNKWPEGYQGFVSAVTPVSPVLSILMSPDYKQAFLSWTQITSNCLPISSFNIYQNGLLINNVSYKVTSTTITGLNPIQNYTFYIESLSTTIKSGPSNTVSSNTAPIQQPVLETTTTSNDNNNNNNEVIVPIQRGLLGNGGYFIIQDTPTDNTIALPSGVTNYNSITIFNKTGNGIYITSTKSIYNSFYAPHGTNKIILQNNITGVFTYVYTSNTNYTIQALFN